MSVWLLNQGLKLKCYTSKAVIEVIDVSDVSDVSQFFFLFSGRVC